MIKCKEAKEKILENLQEAIVLIMFTVKPKAIKNLHVNTIS